MNGAHSETKPSATALNGEELDVVLGRFQSWAATQRPKSVPASNLPREAREISYEQALRTSSYRRPVALGKDAALDPMLQDVRIAGVSFKDSQPERPAEKRVATGRTANTRSVPASVTKTASEPVKAAVPAAAPPSQPARTGAANASKREAAAKSSRVSRTTQPAFRDVLEGTAALTAAHDSPAAALDRAKSQALTLRVSDTEQARIQACAAQANLSVSAYLRQCALGVDELREQVRMALCTLNLPQHETAVQPGLSAIPGILGRFASRWLGRWRKPPESYSITALRG